MPRGPKSDRTHIRSVRFHAGGALGRVTLGIVLTASMLRWRAHSEETERFRQADINPNSLEA